MLLFGGAQVIPLPCLFCSLSGWAGRSFFLTLTACAMMARVRRGRPVWTTGDRVQRIRPNPRPGRKCRVLVSCISWQSVHVRSGEWINILLGYVWQCACAWCACVRACSHPLYASGMQVTGITVGWAATTGSGLHLLSPSRAASPPGLRCLRAAATHAPSPPARAQHGAGVRLGSACRAC